MKHFLAIFFLNNARENDLLVCGAAGRQRVSEFESLLRARGQDARGLSRVGDQAPAASELQASVRADPDHDGAAEVGCNGKEKKLRNIVEKNRFT